MLSGGYIKFGLANKSIAAAMQFLFIAPNLSAYDLSGREACMMDEMITVYYVAYTVFLCLSSIQVVVGLVKDWHEHMRSSRQKRNKRK